MPKNCSPSALCQEICQKSAGGKPVRLLGCAAGALAGMGMPSPEGEKVSASHETLCPTKKSCSEDALRMDLSLVRGINNAGPVGKRHRGNSVCIPAPSHMANWSQRAWKGCRLMAIINSTKRLARGRHQTGSSPGSDPQQVCRALAVPGAESQRAFRFKETHILPQNPAAPICCSIPGTNRPHKSQIFSTGCPPHQKQPGRCCLAPISPL